MDSLVGRLGLVMLLVLPLAAACRGDEGDALSDARAVTIEQRDDGCNPTAFPVDAGETVRLVVTNQTEAAYYLGAEDEGLRPMTVPAGETKSTYYVDPGDGEPHTLRCYAGGGASTTIRVEQASARE
ncbi:MAG: hypothetical protein WEC75_13970 [Dehalococcoidia bacterium]